MILVTERLLSCGNGLYELRIEWSVVLKVCRSRHSRGKTFGHKTFRDI